MRMIWTVWTCLALAGCGSEATEAGTSLLVANVEEDLPHEQRSTLIGVLIAEPVRIAFPDNQGNVDVIVTSARESVRTEAGLSADLSRPPNILRSIEVNAAETDGYTLTAQLIGNPTNAGTEDAPIHTRLVRITRTKSGLMGTESAQMTLRVRPSGVERI
jgi:hypothetical protein